MNIPKDRILKLLVGLDEAIDTASMRGEWTDELIESFGGVVGEGVPLWEELSDLIRELGEPELVEQEWQRLNEWREQS